jgi:molecular chaperone GrpE
MPRERPPEEAVREQLRTEQEHAGDRPKTTDGATPARTRGADGAPKPPRQEPPPGHELDPTEPAGEGDPDVEEELDAETERPPPMEPESAEPADEDPLARAERERDEYLALAQRAQADFENYRKRAARDAALAGERAKAALARELLPVVDNLERALASAHAEEDHLAEGVRLVHAELLGVLAKSGVQPFDPGGESFDPNLHEALSTRPVEDVESGIVVEVVQKGYRLGDTVIRPARVVVSA